MTSEGWQCCNIDSVCGHSLARSIVFVGIATIIISLVALSAALASLMTMDEETDYNNNPMMAMDMLCSLICFSISVYQIIVSLILIARKTPYACSLFFVSHLSILPMYGLMFLARAFVGCKTEQYHIAVIAVIALVVYEGVFLFFLVIVYSYMQAIDDATMNWNY